MIPEASLNLIEGIDAIVEAMNAITVPEGVAEETTLAVRASDAAARLRLARCRDRIAAYPERMGNESLFADVIEYNRLHGRERIRNRLEAAAAQREGRGAPTRAEAALKAIAIDLLLRRIAEAHPDFRF